MLFHHALIAAVVAAVLIWSPVRAGEWSAAGFVFSDELGGFSITSVTGKGTTEDPIVIAEHLHSIEPALLVVRRQKVDGKPRKHPGTHNNGDFLRLAVTAVVTNGSGRAWSGFDLELQESRGKPSVYLDGLSFDQMKVFGKRVFRSDQFATFTDLTEPYDRIRFERGFVNPGDTVRLSFFVTDVTPGERFFVLQEPKVLSAEGPVVDPRARLRRHAGLIPGSSLQVRRAWRHKLREHCRSRAAPRRCAEGRSYAESHRGSPRIAMRRNRRRTAASVQAWGF